MYWVDLSYFGGAGEKLDELVASGSATSMGPNGVNPNPT
jgi:hypothetical protein